MQGEGGGGTGLLVQEGEEPCNHRGGLEVSRCVREEEEEGVDVPSQSRGAAHVGSHERGDAGEGNVANPRPSNGPRGDTGGNPVEGGGCTPHPGPEGAVSSAAPPPSFPHHEEEDTPCTDPDTPSLNLGGRRHSQIYCTSDPLGGPPHYVCMCLVVVGGQRSILCRAVAAAAAALLLCMSHIPEAGR